MDESGTSERERKTRLLNSDDIHACKLFPKVECKCFQLMEYIAVALSFIRFECLFLLLSRHGLFSGDLNLSVPPLNWLCKISFGQPGKKKRTKTKAIGFQPILLDLLCRGRRKSIVSYAVCRHVISKKF